MGARFAPVNLQRLVRLQTQLAQRVVLEDRLSQPIRYIAGTDVAFPNSGETTRAAIVVMDFPGLRIVDQALVEQPTEFPYVPGFLSFREVPALLRAFEKIRYIPDLFLCDGQGIAHPRRFGLACHFGVETGIPAVGVAKSRLTGEYKEPAAERGSLADLTNRGEVIGAVLRTRDRVKPLFISPGHLMTLTGSVERVMACGRGFRLPEPTRQADKLAGAYKQ